MPGMTRSDNPFVPPPRESYPDPSPSDDPFIGDDAEAIVHYGVTHSGHSYGMVLSEWEQIAEVSESYLLRKGDQLFVATPVDPASIVGLVRGE